MLNSIKSKTKKIICSLVLCVGIVASAFVSFQVNKPTIVLANATNNIVKDVTSSDFGTGYNFNVSTSTKPVSPSGWTTLESSSFNSENIVKGVVNLESATTFDTDDCKTSRPSMPITDPDDIEDSSYYKNLMINSHNGSGRFGYESSNSIALQDHSYYRISVYLYTQKTEKSDNTNETDARASIYLTGLIDDKEDEQYSQTKFESLSTLGAWEEYFFYVDTNESKNVKLQLWLGSQDSEVNGAVFFNHVKILRYSEDSYMKQIAELDDQEDDNYNIISLGATLNNVTENGDFEDVTVEDAWKRIAQSTSSAENQMMQSVDANTFSHVNDDLTITPVGTNCSTNNSNALFMYNKNDGFQAIESKDSFTIKQHRYYKLSFWAKSDCNTGTGAIVKLVDQSEKDPVTASLTLATTFTKDSNTFRNDWTKYSFYIYGPATGETTAKIQIWLGTQEEATSGYVFIDDFKIEEIDYNTFSTNSSSSNATAFNLNNATDKYTVTNSNFDITQNDDTTNIYPAIPASWTRTGSNNTTTFSGIVNTTATNFDAEKYGSSITPTKPGALPNQDSDDNNVLMIGSSAETNSQTFKSNALTLAADSYYSISFYTMTDYVRNMTNQNYGARVKIATDTVNVFDYYNLHFADNNWHRFEVLVKTGSEEINPTVSLTFENTIGYVFFDKVELRTINEATYNDNTLTSSEINYFRVDLSNNSFNSNNFNKDLFASNGVDNITHWEFTNNSNTSVGVTYGAISANNNLIDFAPVSLSGNTNYMFISATHDGSYFYKSKKTYTFDAASYYKITIDVVTRNIHAEDKTDDQDYIGGAYMYLADSSKIILKDIKTDEIWKTYTIYASFTDALTSSIQLGLGYTSEAAQGEALFDNLSITKIDQATYLNEIQDADESTTATFIDYEEPEEIPEEEPSTWENTFNWFLIPSILTALAIVIAVVGYYIRKIDFAKKTKVKTNYDRRKTLDKDIDRREKIALRKQIISELEAELKAIDEEVEEYNILAAQQLEEVKAQIKAEQEELQKKKLEIEIKKSEAKAEREKKLKEDETFVSNTKAEKEYNNLLARLDKQELSIQQKLNRKEFKIAQVEETNKAKVSRFAERKEYIRQQIEKIEAEIEEIAKQEEEIWAEYRAAKAEAKQRKTEYKAQLKKEKEEKKAEKARAQKAKEYQARKESKNTPAKKQTTTNKSSKSPAKKSSDSKK